MFIISNLVFKKIKDTINFKFPIANQHYLLQSDSVWILQHLHKHELNE